MYPIYRHMDSYPQQRPYSPYHPNFESIPYQMKPESAKSHSPYEPLPYGGNNYCYPYPMEFHGCCNHNYFPGCYTFRPPYPHFPPPQPFHCHGSYYPSHPHYLMEMPSRYEYDKNTTIDYHCCGCPNHSHPRKEDQNVKIQEPDPDAEKKSRDCLVPCQLENYPHPIVWIPPGYLKNRENGKEKPLELESKDKERNGNSKSFEQEPSFWNGWLPLDMNKLGSLMERGDGRKVQHRKNDEEGRFPFPIFRMPYKPEASERNGLGKNNSGEEYVNKLPSHFSITPVDVSDTDDSINKSLPRGREADFDSVRKMIPEQVEKDGEKKTEKETEGKARSIPVEFRTDNGKRNPSKNSEKRRSSSSSPPKSSKLPPVCLRVDPLPGRKSSSSSPSPPATKGKSEKSNSKSSNLSNMKENRQENMQPPEHVDKSKEVEQSKSKTKAIEMVENDTKNGKELMEAKNEILCQSGGGKCEIGEGKGEIDTIKEGGNIDEAKKVGRNLSDDEAAVIIQSAYRGFEVRKWEPLIKLRLIAKVKDQAAAVKSSIQVLESSSSDVRSDDKQRLVLGETIMNLLLKLDTIQGLHPSIRDIRKSVARELVGLQEQLDSLTTKKPDASIEEAFAAKQMEDLSSTTTGTEEAVENFEPVVVDKQVCGDLENKGMESSVANDEANVEEHKDKLLDIDNGEDLELKPSVDELTHPLVTKENACSEELLKEMPISAEPEGELGPEAEGENDKKLLGEARDGQQEHSAEAQGEEVNEDKNRKSEEEPSEDEATNANGVALALEIEEPKSELPRTDGENDEKVYEEAKHGEEVQPEKAHQDKFDDTNYPQSGVEEITGKIDEFTVQPSENEVNNANDIVQTVEAEESEFELPCVEGDDIIQAIEAKEPQPELPCVEGDDIVQAIEAEEPQPELPCVEDGDIVIQGVVAEEPQLELPCVEGDDIVQAVEAKEPHPELPCAEREPFTGELTDTEITKEAILVEGEKEVLNRDQEIEQRSGTVEQFVPQGSEKLMVESERKLKEENEKLKEMVEKLVEAGKEQLSAISNLSGKVMDLEKKLSKKKKLKMRKCAKKSRTYEDQIVF